MALSLYNDIFSPVPFDLDWDRQLNFWGKGNRNIFNPSIDVQETNKEIVIRADVPGVPKENINVELNDSYLEITGNKDDKKEEYGPDRTWHRVERHAGSFRRRIALPKGVKRDQVRATSKDGVLEIVVLKPESSAPKKIEGRQIPIH